MTQTESINRHYEPRLGLVDATMIVAGSMIGSGIYIVSADMTQNVGSAGWLLAIWVFTGLMTLAAALSYGELSGMYPKAGGQYVYLKEAFNPLAGFLYGWSFFTVIQTATIAAVAVAFSKFAGTFLPILDMKPENILFSIGSLHIYPAQLVAIAIIILLTYINTKGVEGGKIIQTFFTVIKLISLFGLIALGFFIAANHEIWRENWTNGWQLFSRNEQGNFIQNLLGSAAIGGIAAAMVGSIFSSDAWNNVTFIAGEVKNPKKNIGLSLLLGTLIVTIIYLLTNVMYVSVLSMQEIAAAPQQRVAVSVGYKIFGSVGVYIIAVMIMISTFGCNNGLILSGARVYNTMAKDGLFFKKAANLNKYDVPAYALWLQALVASLLCLSGKYGDLLNMIAFVVVLFYALTIWGVFVLRKKKPDVPRPYKAFGYPVVPALYIIFAIAFCIALIWKETNYALMGLVLVLLGIPVYYLFVKNNKAA